MVDEPIGIAVVGAGYWGPNLVRNFQSAPAFRLRWLCDLDVERARRVLGGYSTVRVSADLDEILADPDVHIPHLASIETASVIRGWARAGRGR